MTMNFRFNSVINSREKLLHSLDYMWSFMQRCPQITLVPGDYNTHRFIGCDQFTDSSARSLIHLQCEFIIQLYHLINDCDLFEKDQLIKMTYILSDIRSICRQLNELLSSRANIKDPITERWLDDVYDECERLVDIKSELQSACLSYKAAQLQQYETSSTILYRGMNSDILNDCSTQQSGTITCNNPYLPNVENSQISTRFELENSMDSFPIVITKSP